jgi:transposase InsO family protein
MSQNELNRVKPPIQWNYKILYIDHGSDFTSRHIEQVAVDLKIRLIFSMAGKPRGRGKIAPPPHRA